MVVVVFGSAADATRPMMWGMGLVGLLVAAVLILAAAALIKYLFFR